MSLLHNQSLSKESTHIAHYLRLTILENRANRSKNPLTKRWEKFFSQNDEDRIIAKILERISEVNASFVEFGVGDGLENNTLNLVANGKSRGLWIGGEELKVQIPRNHRVEYIKAWVDLNLLRTILPKIKDLNPTVLSCDLDGNDYQFLEFLLENNIFPKLIVQEYNGIFPPEVEWVMNYNPRHQWAGGHYYGASLKSYIVLLSRFDYTLLCCNLTGTNGFWIRNDYLTFFQDVPLLNTEHFVDPIKYPGMNQSSHLHLVLQEMFQD